MVVCFFRAVFTSNLRCVYLSFLCIFQHVHCFLECLFLSCDMAKLYYIAIISLKAVVSKHVDMTVHGVFEVEVSEERERVFALNHNWAVIAQGTDIV